MIPTVEQSAIVECFTQVFRLREHRYTDDFAPVPFHDEDARRVCDLPLILPEKRFLPQVSCGPRGTL